MGRKLGRTALITLLTGVLSIWRAGPAHADGIMWDAPNAQELVLETAQKAWVEWEGGREKLTIAVRPEGVSPHLAWILPIPAAAKEARLSLTDTLPEWPGQEVRVAAHLASHPVMLCFFFFIMLLLYASWTEGAIVVLIIFVLSAISIGPGPSAPHYADTQVQALSHVELGGLVSELVDAPSIDAFERYLKSKSCKLPAAARNGIEAHIRAGSAFVVSWAKEGQVSKSLAVGVEFPAPKPWYPVRLTSAYGDKRLAIDLYLSGWLAPESSTLPSSALMGYYLGAGDGRRFTRVLYQGRASELTHDWAFVPRPGNTDLRLAAWISGHPLMANILLLLLAAMASGLAVGWLAFPDWRSAAGLRPLILLSASGVLPFLGPKLALRRLRPQERPPDPVPEAKPDAPQAQPVPWHHWAIPVVLVGAACQAVGLATEGAAGSIGFVIGFVFCSVGLSVFQILRGYGRKVSILSSCALSALVPVIGPILGMFSSPEPTKAQARPKGLPARWQAFIFGAAAASLVLNLVAGSWLLELWPIKGATAAVEHSRHSFSNLIRKSNEGATRGNLGQTRSALSSYYGDKDGLYPADLAMLTKPGKSGLPYMEKIHVAKTPGHHPDSAKVLYGKEPDDSGGWLYNNTKGDKDYGELRVNCTHTDTKGSAWDSY